MSIGLLAKFVDTLTRSGGLNYHYWLGQIDGRELTVSLVEDIGRVYLYAQDENLDDPVKYGLEKLWISPISLLPYYLGRYITEAYKEYKLGEIESDDDLFRYIVGLFYGSYSVLSSHFLILMRTPRGTPEQIKEFLLTLRMLSELESGLTQMILRIIECHYDNNGDSVIQPFCASLEQSMVLFDVVYIERYLQIFIGLSADNTREGFRKLVDEFVSLNREVDKFYTSEYPQADAQPLPIRDFRHCISVLAGLEPGDGDLPQAI